MVNGKRIVQRHSRCVNAEACGWSYDGRGVPVLSNVVDSAIILEDKVERTRRTVEVMSFGVYIVIYKVRDLTGITTGSPMCGCKSLPTYLFHHLDIL
jgi:hypothetical protein